MSNIYTSIDQLIGNTPLLELTSLEDSQKLDATILAKVESFNPGGSVKDRIAKAMLDAAEKTGKLTKETTIIEPTSGNTGIGLSMMAAARGYKLIIVMPETMSVEALITVSSRHNFLIRLILKSIIKQLDLKSGTQLKETLIFLWLESELVGLLLELEHSLKKKIQTSKLWLLNQLTLLSYLLE